MRLLCLLLALLVSPALAQDAPKKKKKPATKEQSAKKEQAAKQVRGKPTPEQIRKFNELQKKK